MPPGGDVAARPAPRSSRTSSGATLPARRTPARPRRSRNAVTSGSSRSAATAMVSSSRRGSRRDADRPRWASTRSRATSVQIATTASAARRRSAAGVRVGPAGSVSVSASAAAAGSAPSAGAGRDGGSSAVTAAALDAAALRRPPRGVAPETGLPDGPPAGGSARSARAPAAATAERRPASRSAGRAAVRSSRIARAFVPDPERGGIARPRRGPDPGDRRRSGPAARPAAGSSMPCSARIASMARGPTGPRRSRAQRERMVGRSGSSASAHRTRTTPVGGSSSVLSNAAWASSFMRWADSTMATRAPPSTGMSASSAMRSRMPRALRSRTADDDLAPGPSGPSRCRSG